jgi:FkbM family methyltransferase
MEHLGTKYGGWWVPSDMNLKTVYSVGVGEDISFDLHIQSKYGCDVYLVDPTKRAQTHFEEFVDGRPYSGNIQPDYLENIRDLTVDKSKFHFIPKGLWNHDGDLKFYKQSNPNHVSQSLVEGMFSDDYDVVPVMTLPKDIKIDLLKMDIEGAECKVLEHMLDNEIYPKYLLVEFDLFLKGKDTKGETQGIIDRLQSSGYKILKNDNWNLTLVHTRQ